LVGVADGDTISVLDASKKRTAFASTAFTPLKKRRPYGNRSRENLPRMVAGKDVIADCNKTDRYGRQVCNE